MLRYRTVATGGRGSLDNALGAFIREKRESRGWSQQKLADLVGTSRAYINQIESGQRKWPAKWIRAIAVALSVNEVDLAVAAGRVPEDQAQAYRVAYQQWREFHGDDYEPKPPIEVRADIIERLSDVADQDLIAIWTVVDRLATRRGA